MNIILLSDLQAHKWRQYPETNGEGVNLRILDVVSELTRIRELVIKHNVGALIVLGNILEARSDLHMSLLNGMYYALKGFVDYGIKVILLVGESDKTGVGNEHGLEIFKPFCEVVDHPRTFSLGSSSILAVPFYANPKTVVRAMRQFVTPATRLIVAHTAIQSLTMPSGEVWGQGIAVSDIPKHCTFISGQYPRFTEVVPGRVYFLGSMIQVGREDAASEKYLAVYNTEAKKILFLPTHSPKFVTVRIACLREVPLLRSVIGGNFVTVSSVPIDGTSLGEVEACLLKEGARHVDFALLAPLQVPPLTLHDQAKGTNHEQVLRSYVEPSEEEEKRGEEEVEGSETDAVIEIN